MVTLKDAISIAIDGWLLQRANAWGNSAPEAFNESMKQAQAIIYKIASDIDGFVDTIQLVIDSKKGIPT